MQVSLILITRNEASRLPQLMRLLGKQATLACDQDWEIVVVDNCSTDQSSEKFQEVKRENPAWNLTWVSREENNMGAARAQAAEIAKATMLGFVDADCTPPADWLKNGLLKFSQLEQDDPHLFAIGGGNIPDESGGRPTQALRLMLSHSWGHWGTGHGMVAKQPIRIFHLPTCNLFVNRSALLKLGNFSAHFITVCEDLEISWRAKKAGLHTYFDPALTVTHHQNFAHWPWAQKMFRYGAGQTAVMRDHPGHMLSRKGLALAGIPCFLLVAAAFGLFTQAVAVYFGAVLFLSVSAGLLLGGSQLAFATFAVLANTQLSYLAGMLWGASKLGKIENGKMQKTKEK